MTTWMYVRIYLFVVVVVVGDGGSVFFLLGTIAKVTKKCKTKRPMSWCAVRIVYHVTRAHAHTRTIKHTYIHIYRQDNVYVLMLIDTHSHSYKSYIRVLKKKTHIGYKIEFWWIYYPTRAWHIHTLQLMRTYVIFRVSPFPGPTSLYRVTVIYIFVGSHHSGYRKKYIHTYTHTNNSVTRCGGGHYLLLRQQTNPPLLY